MNLFEKFRQAEEKITQNFRGFKLFGLFEREDVPGKYDVIVSAPWLRDDRASLNLLAEMVRTWIVGNSWWHGIGRFVILPESDPFVKAVLDRMPNEFVQHEIRVINDLAYEGEIIRNAIVITALKHFAESEAREESLREVVAA